MPSILTKAKKSLVVGLKRAVYLHPYAWEEFGNNLAELKQLVSSTGRRMRYLGSEKPVLDVAEYGTVLIEPE